MADNDNHYNVQMEPTVFTSEDILNRCVCTPTRSISDTSTADTIYLDDISIDSSDTIRNDPLQEESPDLEIDEERIHAVQYPSFADRYYRHTLNEQPRGEEPYDPMEEDDSSEDEDIIEEISYHKNKIRDYQKKLINDYNISPGTVDNLIKIL